VVAWNTDKTYLRELEAAGIPVVATSWAAPGEPIVLPTRGEFVVKPSVGAGSKGAGRFLPGDSAARRHASTLHDASRIVMVQPYLDAVDTVGEPALVYFDAKFSHAIRKAAMLPAETVNDLDMSYSRSLYVDEKITARIPGPEELTIGEQVLDFVRGKFGHDLLYARVDLLPTADGPVVIELELVEPSLFLEFADGSADVLADAILDRLPA
jgi:glutathione synthase/RimK-type ligase-like ATP-grasp enzyme